jgi:hypothetical protein
MTGWVGRGEGWRSFRLVIPGWVGPTLVVGLAAHVPRRAASAAILAVPHRASGLLGRDLGGNTGWLAANSLMRTRRGREVRCTS